MPKPAQPATVRRPMTLADLGAVMALEAQAYSHPWSHGNFVDSLAAGHLAEVLERDAGPGLGARSGAAGGAAAGGLGGAGGVSGTIGMNRIGVTGVTRVTDISGTSDRARPLELIGYFIAMVGVDELHLLNLTVTPAAQGGGHGSALLQAVLAEGRARAVGSVWLEVRASNARARALYGRREFAEVGLRRNYYPAAKGREDAVVMRRRLLPPAAVAAGGADAVD